MKYTKTNYPRNTFILGGATLALVFGAIAIGLYAIKVPVRVPVSPLVKAYENEVVPSPASVVVEEVSPASSSRSYSVKQEILKYIIEKFGDRSPDAIVMIKTCENSTFDPHRMSKLNIQKNGRRSYDVGVFQINVDADNEKEIEHLKDWKYNIDQAYKKYQAHENTFYLWSCGDKAGDYTYKQALKAK